MLPAAALHLRRPAIRLDDSHRRDRTTGLSPRRRGAVSGLVRGIMRGPSRTDLLVPLLLGVGSLYNLTAAVTALPAALAWVRDRASRGASQARSLALFASIYLGVAALGIVGALTAIGS